ncbi:hypothetical protein RR42_s1497 [Cupriavidus basilensis]|uniref:Uncharacterized protein n=1 Tax=Cupriavidus basilensis TaxID=68895 RepID=A0A0C4YKK3_9BURK|nr:hypothetical protein RR42_s1497 [Cupriavidus basilensis]
MSRRAYARISGRRRIADLHRLIGLCHANDATGSYPLMETLCVSC